MKKRKHKTRNFIDKSLARLLAVQLLYQYEFYNRERKIEDLKDQLIDNYLLSDYEERPTSYRDRIDLALLDKISSGLILIIPQIDEEISLFLFENNNLNNVPDVMLQIIRLASFELKYLKDIPLKVIINEYVDIAGCFYDSQRVKFVNSILENIAKKNRAEELSRVKNEK